MKNLQSSPVLVPMNGLRWEGAGWLKLLAAGLMLLDHINKYLFLWRFTWLFDVGRLAMPLFVLVAASHLAAWHRQETMLEKGGRMIRRLLIFGLISSPIYIGLGLTGPYLEDGFLPLNVLFTLAAAVGVVVCFARATPNGWMLGVLIFALAGAVVEYGWWLFCLLVAGMMFFRQPDVTRLVGLVLALLSLVFVNQNIWAVLAVIPLCLVVRWQHKLPRLPRCKWGFYAFYPLHLGIIWMVKLMGVVS